jgi:hypothetical protein
MKIGDVFYIQLSYQNYRKCHIVNIFEDNEETMIVYKFYGKYKQWWHYEVEHLWAYENKITAGIIWKRRPKNENRN